MNHGLSCFVRIELKGTEQNECISSYNIRVFVINEYFTTFLETLGKPHDGLDDISEISGRYSAFSMWYMVYAIKVDQPAKSIKKSFSYGVPSLSSIWPMSSAGTLPHRYFKPPNVVKTSLPSSAMNDGTRRSTSHEGLQVNFDRGDLQLVLCTVQCALWQITLQYYQVRYQ